MFRKAIDAYDYGPDLADVTAEYMASKNSYTPRWENYYYKIVFLIEE